MIAAFAVATCITGACTAPGAGSPGTANTRTVSASPGDAVGARIPQPPLPARVPTAPEERRVDLVVPRFSDPTSVTNPLFPVSDQASVLFVGHVDGKPFRTEVTLLPQTRVIEWGGQRVETLVSQYVAYLDGRIQEVAYDLYAQADDGSVWYFGEDVADLSDGSIVTKEGTWLAGKDGPAQMIMPGNPQIGDAFRTENIPGIAFEEVTIDATDRTLRGPLGPIPGGLVARELHMDGSTEAKLFAPGYGEFFTGGGGDVEALALAVPTDAADGPVPAPLTTLQEGANRIFDASFARRWARAGRTLEGMSSAWSAARAEDLPRLVAPRLGRAIRAAARAVRARDVPASRQAAIEVARWSLDLQLRYRPPFEIDLARFDLWAAQLLVDAEAGDRAAANSDVFALFYVRDRILQGVAPEDLPALNTQIGRLQVAGPEGDLERASTAASRLRDVVARIRADE